jgi:hypothetical protein
MKTKTHAERVSRAPHPGAAKTSSELIDVTPELTLIALLFGLILLRVLDLCAATPDAPACAAPPANRAAISCAIHENPQAASPMRPVRGSTRGA